METCSLSRPCTEQAVIFIVLQLQLSSPLYCLGNLQGEEGAAERTVEDVFIRRFMFGTFHNCLANEIVIKRRGNLIIVCAIMLQKLPPQKFYFLIGYTESLLSHFYKCPVKLDIQTLQDKAVYKYLWGATAEDIHRIDLHGKEWILYGFSLSLVLGWDKSVHLSSMNTNYF